VTGNENSNVEILHMIKGTLAGFVALIACPCHLPLTLPAILLLTSGTAAGLWLAANQWFVWLASLMLFVGGLGLAFLWINRDGAAARCEVPQNRLKRTPTSRRPGPSNRQKQLDLTNGANGARSNQTKEVSHV
jgi:mercuric ion transport protein